MRSAVLTAGDDLGFEAGPRRRAPSKPRKSGAQRKPARKASGKARKQWLQKATRYAAVGCSALVVVGILVNALMLQKGRHPAPLFVATATKSKPVDASPRLMSQTAVQPTPAPTPAVPLEPAPAPAESSSVAPATAAVPAPKPKDRSASATLPHDDAIARLLAGEPPTRVASSASQDGSRPTMDAVQKALARQGFPAGHSGHLDAATRKALEHYQTSHHLPTKEPLGARTLKSLGLNGAAQ